MCLGRGEGLSSRGWGLGAPGVRDMDEIDASDDVHLFECNEPSCNKMNEDKPEPSRVGGSLLAGRIEPGLIRPDP